MGRVYPPGEAVSPASLASRPFDRRLTVGHPERVDDCHDHDAEGIYQGHYREFDLAGLLAFLWLPSQLGYCRHDPWMKRVPGPCRPRIELASCGL